MEVGKKRLITLAAAAITFSVGMAGMAYLLLTKRKAVQVNESKEKNEIHITDPPRSEDVEKPTRTFDVKPTRSLDVKPSPCFDSLMQVVSKLEGLAPHVAESELANESAVLEIKRMLVLEMGGGEEPEAFKRFRKVVKCERLKMPPPDEAQDSVEFLRSSVAMLKNREGDPQENGINFTIRDVTRCEKCENEITSPTFISNGRAPSNLPKNDTKSTRKSPQSGKPDTKTKCTTCGSDTELVRRNTAAYFHNYLVVPIRKCNPTSSGGEYLTSIDVKTTFILDRTEYEVRSLIECKDTDECMLYIIHNSEWVGTSDSTAASVESMLGEIIKAECNTIMVSCEASKKHLGEKPQKDRTSITINQKRIQPPMKSMKNPKKEPSGNKKGLSPGGRQNVKR
jgi:DNA-directed RNA polymerase subunit M/transcription elongation factor TFIIS